MGTILAKSIVSRASSSLNDLKSVRWSPSEMLEYLNDGQREVGIHKPDAITVVEAVQMVIGSLQNLPTTGIRVVDALCNAGADGTAQGAAVRVCEREMLDDTAGRNWRSTTPANEVENVLFDGRYPTVYQVYPPQASSGRWILLAWQKSPAECTIAGVNGSTTDLSITLNDIYSTALHEYLLHRAYNKDSDTRDTSKSAMHYSWFMQRLGIKVQADRANDVNRNAPPAQQSRQVGGASQRARSD